MQARVALLEVMWVCILTKIDLWKKINYIHYSLVCLAHISMIGFYDNTPQGHRFHKVKIWFQMKVKRSRDLNLLQPLKL